MDKREQAFYEEVGRRVRSHRRRLGWSQERLGDEVNLARTSITNIEQGNQPVSSWLLARFSLILGSSVEQLVPELGEADPATALPTDMPPKAAEIAQRYAIVTA